MTVDVSALRKLFRETIETSLESGVNCPPGLDFDAPRPGIAPGNLWDPPSEWQSREKRKPIGEAPAAFQDHPRHDELLEAFSPSDYVGMNPDLQGEVSEPQALEHFVEQGYREQRPYSRAIWAAVSPDYYRNLLGTPESDEISLRRHYSYVGRFEDRFPNDLTAWVAGTRVHLWQMGKVGSLSIQRALLDQYTEPSVHLHFVDAWHRDRPTIGVHYSRLLHHHGHSPKVIVCGVRDPIERVVSGYFQEAESLGIQGRAFESAEHAVCQLAGRMVADLWTICGWFGHRFFDDRSFFRNSFDREVGCVEHEAGGHRVWVYRQDRLRGLASELGSVLGYAGVTFPSVNISTDKAYADLYRLIVDCVELPELLVDRVYASEYAKYFGYEKSLPLGGDRCERL